MVVVYTRNIGGGFYWVARTVAHVLGARVVTNPLKLLRIRIIEGDYVILVGTVFSAITYTSLPILTPSVLYITAEGPFEIGLRKSFINHNRNVKVITPSYYSKMELEGQGVRVDGVIPHGVDPCEIPNIAVNNVAEPRMISVISSTDLYKIMGIAILLKAVSRSEYLRRGVKVLLKVPPALGPFVRRMAFDLGLKHVDIIDAYLDRKSLYKLLAGASVYVHSSLSDAFGLPIIEGMAVGTPAVVLDAPPWNEIVTDDVGFLVRVNKEFIYPSPRYRIRVPDLNYMVRVLEQAVEQGGDKAFRARVKKYALTKFNAHKLYTIFTKLLTQ